MPAWAYAGWRGRYFPRDAPPLPAYARVFDTVEANTTFYTLPDANTVARWREALHGTDLRLCFKLPRDVTHGGMADEHARLAAMFERIAPLADWFGPFMVQLPPRFGPKRLAELDALLGALPREFTFAVEVRHRAFFDAPEALFEVLARHGAGRVLLDSRPIYGAAPPHPDIAAAAHEKPDVPVRWDGPERVRVVRFVGHPIAAHNTPFMSEWAQALATWLRDDREVHVMVHCPNDLHCPELARQLHGVLRTTFAASGGPELAPLPAWPVPQLGLPF